jgi:sugar O-acyltransferase (sialic acid O-acetyltransferase NeuD family)
MLIAGAGGMAKEILEILLQKGYEDTIYLYDDLNPGIIKLCDHYKVLKTINAVEDLFSSKPYFCLGLGDGRKRKTFYEKFIKANGKPFPVISPFACIGKLEINIGSAVCIATGSVLTTHISLGDGCIVNVNCTISHDCTIGSYTTISPGVHIAGNCHIGQFCMIGAGAVILPGIRIGDNVCIGAGAVVTKNIESNITVAGVPAVNIKPQKR